MMKNNKLAILSEAEKFALYGLPDFNDKQRREYFNFSENEMRLIKLSYHTHVNIYCALQIGYFKAKKIFFQILWEDIIHEDLQFVVHHYFSDTKITKITVTKHQYYAQCKEIIGLFGYQLWAKELSSKLYEQAAQIIKRDTSPNFIARELITFLNDIKVVRPGYTTLQTIVSKSLTDERKRISNILDIELTGDHKLSLEKLITADDSFSKLASFKQDAKNFGFKMMLKERHKHNLLEFLYKIAKDVIQKLNISMHNIDHYVNLANHYTIRDLRELKYNQNYLYILCYIFKRYQQLNDNLIEAFIYHIKKLDKTIQSKVK